MGSETSLIDANPSIGQGKSRDQSSQDLSQSNSKSALSRENSISKTPKAHHSQQSVTTQASGVVGKARREYIAAQDPKIPADAGNRSAPGSLYRKTRDQLADQSSTLSASNASINVEEKKEEEEVKKDAPVTLSTEKYSAPPVNEPLKEKKLPEKTSTQQESRRINEVKASMNSNESSKAKPKSNHDSPSSGELISSPSSRKRLVESDFDLTAPETAGTKRFPYKFDEAKNAETQATPERQISLVQNQVDSTKAELKSNKDSIETHPNNDASETPDERRILAARSYSINRKAPAPNASSEVDTSSQSPVKPENPVFTEQSGVPEPVLMSTLSTTEKQGPTKPEGFLALKLEDSVITEQKDTMGPAVSPSTETQAKASSPAKQEALTPVAKRETPVVKEQKPAVSSSTEKQAKATSPAKQEASAPVVKHEKPVVGAQKPVPASDKQAKAPGPAKQVDPEAVKREEPVITEQKGAIGSASSSTEKQAKATSPAKQEAPTHIEPAETKARGGILGRLFGGSPKKTEPAQSPVIKVENKSARDIVRGMVQDIKGRKADDRSTTKRPDVKIVDSDSREKLVSKPHAVNTQQVSSGVAPKLTRKSSHRGINVETKPKNISDKIVASPSAISVKEQPVQRVQVTTFKHLEKSVKPSAQLKIKASAKLSDFEDQLKRLIQELNDYRHNEMSFTGDRTDEEIGRRIKVNRTIRGYQLAIGRVRHSIRTLKFAKNSVWDPIIDTSYYPTLARSDSSEVPMPLKSGTIGSYSPKERDFFELNPPQFLRREMDTRALSSRFQSNQTTPKDDGRSFDLGDRCAIVVDNERVLGTIKFEGARHQQASTQDKFTNNRPQTRWIGIALDRPLGCHDGLVKGHRYFQCEAYHGILVQSSRVKRA